MEFRILGPLEVYDEEGAHVALPAGRERALLIVLLLRRSEVVSVDTLIEALWGEHAPSTAPKAVQGYVSHLRRVLGAGAHVLSTQAPGYVLRLEDEELDAARFERLAADGRRALEDSDAAAALEAFNAALAVWRGPALAEFAYDDFAQAEIQRLTERRLETHEDRTDALLQLARHAGLVAELEALVKAHPERERLRGQLMLALYRAGRQADALRVFTDGRRLANELGLDPSPELRRLEKAILEHDPAIAPPAGAPPVAETPQTPSEVPAPEPPRRRRRGTVVLALVLLALAASLAGVALALTRDGPASVQIVPPAVAVIDPATNRVVETVRVGSRPTAIAAGNGAVWVGDTRDGTVTRIDPATLDTKAIGIGAPAVDLSVHGGNVWVATGSFGMIVRIDAELGSVADQIPLGEAGHPVVPPASTVAAGREGVWVGSFEGLVQIDPRTGRELKRVDLGRTPAEQTAVGGGAVWSTTIANRATRVEASSAEQTADFYPGVTLYPVAVTDDAVWVGGAGGRGGQLWRLDPVTGAQELSTRLDTFPVGVATDLDAVWVAVAPPANAVLRVDPETGDVLQTIDVGGWPEDVAVASGRVWVTVTKEEPAG